MAWVCFLLKKMAELYYKEQENSSFYLSHSFQIFSVDCLARVVWSFYDKSQALRKSWCMEKECSILFKIGTCLTKPVYSLGSGLGREPRPKTHKNLICGKGTLCLVRPGMAWDQDLGRAGTSDPEKSTISPYRAMAISPRDSHHSVMPLW